MEIYSRLSRVRTALRSITEEPTPINQVIEEHKVARSSLLQGVSRYPTTSGKIKVGYLVDGTQVIYREKQVQS